MRRAPAAARRSTSGPCGGTRAAAGASAERHAAGAWPDKRPDGGCGWCARAGRARPLSLGRRGACAPPRRWQITLPSAPVVALCSSPACVQGMQRGPTDPTRAAHAASAAAAAVGTRAFRALCSVLQRGRCRSRWAPALRHPRQRLYTRQRAARFGSTAARLWTTSADTALLCALSSRQRHMELRSQLYTAVERGDVEAARAALDAGASALDLVRTLLCCAGARGTHRRVTPARAAGQWLDGDCRG